VENSCASSARDRHTFFMQPARFFIFLRTALAVAAIALLPSFAIAQTGNDRVQVRLVIDRENIQPSESADAPAARIGVLLQIAPGWHTYWQNSGEAAVPTKVSWQLPPGWTAGTLQWPAPSKFLERGEITTYGYRGETMLFSNLFTPQVIPEDGRAVTIGAKVSWLVCKEICVPGQQTVQVEIPFSTSLSLQPSLDYPLFEKYSALAPQPRSALEKIPAFSESVITPLAMFESENSLKIGLEWKPIALADPKSLSANIQVFPYLTPGLMFSAPEAKSDQSSALIRIGATRNASGNPARASGIIVVSSALTGLGHDTSFEWSAPVDRESPDAAVQLGGKEGYEPLTFRTFSAELPVSAKEQRPIPVKADYTGLLQAMLAAFIAGLLLNLMPCVLPIISIKIMGFLNQANQSRTAVVRSSLAFAAGVLASFLTLAVVLISLRSVGFSLGWGFQFQYPQFVAGLLLVVFFLSLALFDFYTVNLPFMQNANEAASKVHSPIARHFFDGVLATALSTPCTAPVLGTALVFAFSQPPIFTVLIFLMIGVGLSLPYVYCSTHPAAMRFLPQPGAWMFHFRQVMGFLLLGTCAWLLFVLHDLTDKGAVWATVLMLVLFFCLWARKTALESKPERERSVLLNLLFFGALFGSGWWLYPGIVARKGAPARMVIPWVPYSQNVLEDAARTKRPVFLDFTASWCITCKFNELRIIETKAAADAMKRFNILPVKADWTTGDEAITAALKSYGAEGVPLYVILPADGGKPIILSTLPSQSSLLEALESGAKH